MKKQQGMSKRKSNKQPLSVSITQYGRSLINFNEKMNKQICHVYQSCRIFRNYRTGSNKFLTLQQVKKGKTPINNHTLIASINTSSLPGQNKKYKINKPCPVNNSLPLSQVYVSLRSYSKYYDAFGYQLNVGDLIKFSNRKFRVVAMNRKYSSQNSNYPKDTQQIDTSTKEQYLYKKSKSFHYQNISLQGPCKICLHDDIQQGDFMTTPCQCKGSCANVHYKCLKKWMTNKVQIQKSGKIISYNFKKFKCQICKSFLPKSIVQLKQREDMQDELVQNYLFDLILGKQTSYIILQPQNQQKWVAIVLNQLQSIHIGRSMTADLVILDNLISRVHAQLIYTNGNFHVRDLYSEHGTFVLLNKQFHIKNPVQLQVENTLFEFSYQYRQQERQRMHMELNRC